VRKSDNGRDPASLGTAVVIRETRKAILVRLDDRDREEVWIPKSVIHDDSEVYDVEDHDKGELYVQMWWADKEGY